MKEQKGITLVALIITIIVLLILAVVAIAAVSGDGIINYSKNAKNAYQNAANEENTFLNQKEGQLNDLEKELLPNS